MNDDGDIGEVVARYPYRARWWTLIWTSTFFAVCGAVIAHEARVADDPMLWGLAIVSWGFVVIAGVSAVLRLARPGEVIVGTTGIAGPVGRRQVVMRFTDLVDAEVHEVHGQRFLKLVAPAGNLTLNRAMFPRNREFDAVEAYALTGVWNPEAPSSPVVFHKPPMWMPLALKITALLSFCGGPLWTADALAPHIGKDPGFAVAFAPLAVVILATLSALEDERTKWTTALAWAGAVCCVVMVLESVAATASILGGEVRGDTGLILFGSGVSVLAALLYARIARRFLAS